MNYITIAISIGLAISFVMAQGPKRNRAEGFYQCASSNTLGDGNTWITARGIGFLWDDSPENAGSPKPFPFLEVASETGVYNFMSLLVESRVLSYPKNNWWQFGNIAAGARFTVPNNKELRFRGYGLECKWIYNSQPEFSSLAGYREGGTGFAPEGYIVHGNNFQFKFIHDMDFISQFSWLPIKMGVNAGMRIPFAKAPYIFPQYLFDAGLAYIGLGFDVFAEYSLEAFSNLLNQKTIDGLGGVGKRIEVYFSENPMYVSLGGRIRYDNGMTLFACVPFLVSANVGSSMAADDKKVFYNSISPGDKYYEERVLRKMSDPFDPWFAKWKIVAELSFPIRYKQTGAEMMRNFLLLKNRKESKKIDIDERLHKLETPDDSLKNEDTDKKRRLDEIRKRREQIDKGE